MKRSVIFFICLLALSSFSIADKIEDYNSYSQLQIMFNINSNIQATITDSSKLNYLKANLLLLPDNNYMQSSSLINISSNPDSEKIYGNSFVELNWNQISNNYQYDLNAIVITNNKISKIPFIKYPISNISPELKIYLEPQKITDINEKIIKKTNELIQDQDNLFEASFQIAEWVHNNIKYDLNTLTESASQKSSWVYDNKDGVCDEITSLFISMARSAGIPARFVTGMVYSNINYQFGNHGWAELYFPDYGWVPFDVTFGEYGWIDPSHVKLSDSLDAGQPSIEYSWKSYQFDVENTSLNLNSNIIQTGAKINPPYIISIESLVNKVGPGSYVPVKVIVKNPYDYYGADSISMVKSLNLTETNSKNILLQPHKDNELFWIMKVPESLDQGYTYEATLEARDSFYAYASTKISYAEKYDSVTLEEANKKILENSDSVKKQSSAEVSLQCQSDKIYYNIGENLSINCDVTSLKDSLVSNLQICISDSCKNFDLNPRDIDSFTFNKLLNNVGDNSINVVLQNDNIYLRNFIKINIFENGPIILKVLDYPEDIDYNTIFSLRLELKSYLDINSANIKIDNYHTKEINNIRDPKIIEFSVKSNDYIKKPLKISIEYKDQDGKTFLIDKELKINVTNIPWYIKLLSFFRII